jgi:hypothetical protein
LKVLSELAARAESGADGQSQIHSIPR